MDRQGCAIILADTWPEKIGKAVIFISLNVEPATREGAVAALDLLRAELVARGVPVKDDSWGYRLLVVDDPDGNQLFFNYPSDTPSGQVAGRRGILRRTSSDISRRKSAYGAAPRRSDPSYAPRRNRGARPVSAKFARTGSFQP